MKNTTNNRFYKHFFSALMLCAITGSTHGMKRLKEEFELSKATSSATEENPPRVQKMKNIWIKTSDKKLIAMPEWQVDQVKVLQMLLLNQKGTNSKQHPIDASNITKNNGAIVDTSRDTLDLIKTALNVSKKPENMLAHLQFLSTDKKNQNDSRTLINTAADLEANALSAALASAILPQEIQTRIEFTILIPILDYFVKALGTPFISPQSRYNTPPIAHAPLIKISQNGQYILLNNRYNGGESSLLDLKAQTRLPIANAMNNLNFSSTGIYVVAYTPNQSYYIAYDYISAKKAFDVHHSSHIVFSPNDEYCLFNSTNNPGIINIKSYKDGTNWVDLPPLQGHTAHVNTIQFSPDGNYIVSGSNDTYPNNLILWDGNSFKKITSFSYEGPWSSHLHPVVRAHFTPDNKYIISTDKQQNTIVWDIVSQKPVVKLDIENKALWQVDSYQPTFFEYSIPKFVYSPQSLHTYMNADTNQKILYELSINKIFNHSVLPVNNNAISTLVTDLKRKAITCKQYYSMPPFEFRQNVNIIPNNGYNLEYAVESPDSQYLLLAYHPRYITLTLTEEKKSLTIPAHPYHTIKFSPKNDYIIITHPPTVPNNRMFTTWKIADLKMMLDISYDSSITLSQSRFLYRMYIAHMNRVKVIIDKNDPDYAVYKSLSTDLQNLVDKFLPFEIASDKAQETLKKS
jgi:WD40 repeat protein